MVSAFLLRIPLRIYTLRGLRLETVSGLRRFVLFACEYVAAACSHRVVCVSKSLRDAYLKLKCTAPGKALVLRAGSSNGVDADRFVSTTDLLNRAAEVRAKYSIAGDGLVLGFVGRLTRDKGVADLLEVFEQVRGKYPELHLLVVGGFEEGDSVDSWIRHRLLNHDQIHVTGMVDLNEIEAYYRACDLLLFPSYREGFPNAVLEAQASELAVIGYAATGTLDAIDDGRTGVIVPLGDCDGLIAAVSEYLSSEQLRQKHGQAGRVRVQESFCPQGIWEALTKCYEDNLPQHEFGHFGGAREYACVTSQSRAA
jgi:glycosyltransferase involved in cell wall biosynthesis